MSGEPVVRVINLIGAEMTSMLRARFGDRVEVVDLEPDGPIDVALAGEVLVAPGRAAGRPTGEWLVEVTRRGVKWVHIAGAGVGDLPDAVFEDERVVTCSRGAMATPISEFVLSSMLAFEKRFPFSWIEKPPPHGWGYAGELDPSTAESRFEPPPRWGYAELGTLDGRVLGIFGFGSIGRETARKAIPFGMTVLAVRRTAAGVASEGVETVTLEEMVGRSDHVVIAASATPATFHAFDARVFNAMKRGAHLVNIARGSIVDQDALLSALDEGIVAFASLDVTDPEPLPAGHPLYAHPKVHLTPHISWCSPLKQRRTGEIVLENVEHYLRGEPLHGYVARDQRY